MKAVLLFLSALFLAVSSPFGARAAPLDAAPILDEARASCASIEGGVFSYEDGAITEVDLSGDGAPDLIVDERLFRCTSAATMYCGTGGCGLHALVDGRRRSWQSSGWRLVDWDDDRILLIGRDGVWCGGAGSEWCYEAVFWSGGRFLSVREEDPREKSTPLTTPPYTTEDFDAVAALRCSLGADDFAARCPVGIVRGDRGEASLRIAKPDGAERVLNISKDEATSPQGGDATVTRDGDSLFIAIDGMEFYEVPDAAVNGG